MGVKLVIKLKDLITEGKISSDVERAAKKLGINFKKEVKTNSRIRGGGEIGMYER